MRPALPCAPVPRSRLHRAVAPALGLCLAAAVAGCGGGGAGGLGPPPDAGRSGDSGAQELGFPGFATKNTTRIGGADPVADTAAAALAAYPGAGQSPRAVALAPKGDWRAALASTSLVGRPLGAPVLLAGSDSLPDPTAAALVALRPTGAAALGGAQVIRVGDAAAPPGRLRTITVRGRGSGPAALAAAVDRLRATAAGRPSASVVVVSQDAPAFAMPAAAWAAKSGDPILFVSRDAIPAATRAALRAHGRPRIYVLGPPAVVSGRVLRGLGALGRARRIAGPDPVSSAIAFARFSDGPFGWRVVDPGHGLSFASTRRPLDAVAAAPLAAAGTYGPLLVVQRPAPLPRALQQYLLDIQPGYTDDPVRGVYNHGWVIGDAQAISIASQAQIDQLLEIAPVAGGSSPSS